MVVIEKRLYCFLVFEVDFGVHRLTRPIEFLGGLAIGVWMALAKNSEMTVPRAFRSERARPFTSSKTDLSISTVVRIQAMLRSASDIK